MRGRSSCGCQKTYRGTYSGEVRGLVHDGAALGVRAGGLDLPEDRAEMDVAVADERRNGDVSGMIIRSS